VKPGKSKEFDIRLRKLSHPERTKNEERCEEMRGIPFSSGVVQDYPHRPQQVPGGAKSFVEKNFGYTGCKNRGKRVGDC